jgi:hypothetical protein
VKAVLIVCRTVVAATVTALFNITALLIAGLLDSLTGEPKDHRIFPFDWSKHKTATQIERYRKWRHVLGKYISSTADTTSVTGFALLASAYATLKTDGSSAGGDNYHDSYWTLIVYLCCVCSSTHIASLLAMRNHISEHLASSAVRIFGMTCFGIALAVTVDLSRYAYESMFVVLEDVTINKMHIHPNVEHILEDVLPPLAMAAVYWNAIVPLAAPALKHHREPRHIVPAALWRFARYALFVAEPPVWRWLVLFWKVLKYILRDNVIARFFSKAFVVLFLQLTATIVTIVYLLIQKLAKATPATDADKAMGIYTWCSLNNKWDNQWGFGSSCSMILLIVPFYVAIGNYLGKRTSHKSNDISLVDLFIDHKFIEEHELDARFIRFADEEAMPVPEPASPRPPGFRNDSV